MYAVARAGMRCESIGGKGGSSNAAVGLEGADEACAEYDDGSKGESGAQHHGRLFEREVLGLVLGDRVGLVVVERRARRDEQQALVADAAPADCAVRDHHNLPRAHHRALLALAHHAAPLLDVDHLELALARRLLEVLNTLLQTGPVEHVELLHVLRRRAHD
eukprot:1822893-Pleurochrysis_carterae.AAC.2